MEIHDWIPSLVVAIQREDEDIRMKMHLAGAETDPLTKMPKGWEPSLIYDAPEDVAAQQKVDQVERIADTIMGRFGLAGTDAATRKGDLESIFGSLNMPDVYQGADGKLYSDPELTQEVKLPPGAVFVPQ